MSSAPGESVELISEEALLSALRALHDRGVTAGDAEIATLLGPWCQEQETAIEAIADKKSQREMQVYFELKKAALYWRAGFIDEAEGTWQAALDVAHYEGLNDVYARAFEEKTRVKAG